jgi:hypothetical protein
MLAGSAGVVLELPEKNVLVFLVLVVLLWWFFKHTYNVFDEMLKRQ